MRYLAVDYGDKRTGLAVCDAAETLATPYTVIETQNAGYLIEQIARIAAKEGIEAIVLGLPLNMDGAEGARAKRTRDFGRMLSARLNMPVEFHDERMSSYIADSFFAPGQMTRDEKKKRMDAVAAAVILQSFLSHSNTANPTMYRPVIRCVADPAAMAERAAAEFVAAAQQAVAQREAFYVAISGGKTPLPFFEQLAQPAVSAQIPWDNTYLFWADERCVPPDSPDSNYRLANEALISRVPIPAAQVFRIHGEYDDCALAADAYESQIQAVFELQEGQFPVFDLIVLGLGQDGHIASLLPGDPSVSMRDRLTWPVYHDTRLNRVTLTPPVLQNARRLMVLVAGQDKATIVHQLFSSPPDTSRFPAYVLWPVLERVLWLLDMAAAGMINKLNGLSEE